MKVSLPFIPTLKDRERVYGFLQSNAPWIAPPGSTVEKELALYIQWSRFDSRLAEILVKYLIGNWKALNPVYLNDAILSQSWPSSAGVLFEFVHLVLKDKKSKLDQYKLWKALVLQGVKPAEPQLFFIGLQPLAAKSVFEDAQFPLEEYRKWGYLGREVLLNKSALLASQKMKVQSMGKEVRLRVIGHLARQHEVITVQLYLDTIHHGISRRQAERDLKGCSFLKPVGNTHGRFYRVCKMKLPS